MNETSLVSVIMTSFNREEFIAEAIKSVLNSTYKNFELIIVDDGSTDNTVKIAESYQRTDNRIRIYINEKNLGDYSNRNKSAGYAMGKYIKYLDSDDAIYDWGLAYCVEIMEKNPKAAMGIFQSSNKVEDIYLEPAKAINQHFFENTFLNIGPSGTILRRDCFEKAGMFRPIYGAASDMYFNIKMASLFPIVMLKKEFFFYREHEGQEIKNSDSYLFYNYPYMRDILALPELPVSAEGRRQLLLRSRKSLLKDCLRNIKNTGRVSPAYKAMKLSGLKFPEIIKTIFS